MRARIDIATWNGDIVLVDGDLALAQADEQHIQDTISGFAGWWKEAPADGVGVFQYAGSAGSVQDLARAIMLQLRGDGYECNNPAIGLDGNGKLSINPNVTNVQGS